MRTWHATRGALAITAGLFAGSCAQGTQLLVVVTAAPELRDAVGPVLVVAVAEVSDDDGALGAPRSFAVPDGAEASFAVVPRGGDAARVVTIAVTGCASEPPSGAACAVADQVARTSLRTAFLRGQRVTIRVELSTACTGVTCSEGEVCRAMGSVAVCEPLPTFARDGGIDAGTDHADAVGVADVADASGDVAPLDTGACPGCAPRPNTTVSCASGPCSYECDEGFDDCDRVAENGCEADLRSSAEHCGMCDDPCGAGEACASRACFGASTVVQVVCGSQFSCARYADGRIYCWGSNDAGQLGNGVVREGRRTSPGPVVGVTDAIDIAAGEAHACAVRRDGTVACWGAPGHGALGSGGSGTSEWAPIAVPDVGGAARVGPGVNTPARSWATAASCAGAVASRASSGPRTETGRRRSRCRESPMAWRSGWAIGTRASSTAVPRASSSASVMTARGSSATAPRARAGAA